MNIIYSDKIIPNKIVKSIFLAGLSQREMDGFVTNVEFG